MMATGVSSIDPGQIRSENISPSRDPDPSQELEMTGGNLYQESGEVLGFEPNFQKVETELYDDGQDSDTERHLPSETESPEQAKFDLESYIIQNQNASGYDIPGERIDEDPKEYYTNSESQMSPNRLLPQPGSQSESQMSPDRPQAQLGSQYDTNLLLESPSEQEHSGIKLSKGDDSSLDDSKASGGRSGFYKSDKKNLEKAEGFNDNPISMKITEEAARLEQVLRAEPERLLLEFQSKIQEVNELKAEVKRLSQEARISQKSEITLFNTNVYHEDSHLLPFPETHSEGKSITDKVGNVVIYQKSDEDRPNVEADGSSKGKSREGMIPESENVLLEFQNKVQEVED